MLKLPIATCAGSLPWVDAFFTATSAICVTGLIVVDTGSTFTPFGQGVILALIQIGGLGIMVFSMFFILLFGKNLSIRDRFIAKESLLGKISFTNLFSLLKNILVVTFVVEIIGAVLLFCRFRMIYESGYAWYSAFFHAISAFCNAGFSLYSSSLMKFAPDPIINATIMALIILGGLGFPVLYELFTIIIKFIKRETIKLSLHCKIVLITTIFLLITGTILFFILEFANPLHHQEGGITLCEAFFQSVTARTAGFNTIAVARLSNPALFVLIVLMFIGGSPASTAGGIKTTSFFIFLALLKRLFSGRDNVEIFQRTIPKEIVYKVLGIIIGSLFLVIFVNVLLQITEAGFMPHNSVAGSFLETLFETVSAFGTVGLSTGLTPTLTSAGKCIIMLTMLIGRIGPLTFALALVGQVDKKKFSYPEDSAMVG